MRGMSRRRGALALLCCASAAGTRVRYLQRTSAMDAAVGDAWLELLAANGTTSSVSEFDDTPLETVELGFAFPFMGELHRHVFLNPNGAVQARRANPGSRPALSLALFSSVFLPLPLALARARARPCPAPRRRLPF